MANLTRSGFGIAILAVVLGLSLVQGANAPNDGLAKKMLPIYVREAEAYFLAVDSAPKTALELRKEPIFEWANPTRNDQQGVVFLWLRDGRPAALASIFSTPHYQLPGRIVTHELHALDRKKLLVKRDADNLWRPEAGLDRKELPNSPAPAATAAERLVQLRQLARDFTGSETDPEGKQWDLRLLPTPLYRYPAARAEVIDGALFALVSTAGTDPEVLLLIEAVEAKGKLHWEYACGRFSDWELHVRRQDAEVFSSMRSDANPFAHGPQHLYRLFEDKVVTVEGKVLARIRQNPSPPDGGVPGGKTTPVGDPR